MFKTIKENTSSEIVEKKSKFIANLFYIESVEEAEQIIKQTDESLYANYITTIWNCRWSNAKYLEFTKSF